MLQVIDYMKFSFGFLKMKTSLTHFSHHASQLSKICIGMDTNIYFKIYIK